MAEASKRSPALGLYLEPESSPLLVTCLLLLGESILFLTCTNPSYLRSWYKVEAPLFFLWVVIFVFVLVLEDKTIDALQYGRTLE